jgi:predicted MPP superfamily phosphohydrolase
MKIAHVTDPHFNFIVINEAGHRNEVMFANFCDQIREAGCEAVVISGDITEAPYIQSDLKLFEKHLALPIYFVLGNHDFYHGSFASVWKTAEEITNTEPFIKWLQISDPIQLQEKTCLIGDDGWYDIKAGGAEFSRLMMTDFHLIHDFRHQMHMSIVAMSRKLAFESTERLEQKIRKAVEQYDTIYIATHVPPYLEAALSPQRKLSDFSWAPYMTNIMMGDMLIQVAEEFRDKKFIVLAGHTHTSCLHKAWHNIEVRVGQAEYKYLMFYTIEVQ